MRTILFYLPLEVAGIPVFGFGLLLAVWVAVSLGLLAWLARRQGFNSDTWSYAPLLALMGAIIWWLLPLLCQPRGLPIRGFGMMAVIATVAATALAVWRARRSGLEDELVLSLAFWLFLPGIIGARMFYVVEYWPERYRPIYEDWGLKALLGAVINVPEGGLVVYGAVIGGMLGLAALVRRYRLPPLPICDLIAPSLMLGVGLGRLGCLLNGCCFGGACDLPWAVTFPWNGPSHVHQVHHRQAFVHGLKIDGGGDDLPEITQIEPGSPAQRHGLKPGQQLTEIGGISIDVVDVDKTRRAYWALLNAHQLHVLIRRQDGQYTRWTLEDPPLARPIHRFRHGQFSLYGLQIDGEETDRPVITEVRRGSPAAREGLQPGEQIVAVNGRSVQTIQDVLSLLSEHKRAPWIAIKTVGAESAAEWTIPYPLPRSARIHPTQIYSSINALLLCLLLLACDRFLRRDGALFALMITLYPITRFLLEIIRTDESAVYGTGMSISQNVSLVLLVCAIGLWCYILRQSPRPMQHAGQGLA